MTRREAERQTRQADTLRTLGLTSDAMTGRAYAIPDRETGAERRLRHIIAARNQRALATVTEGALDEDIAAVCDLSVVPYLQTDPRGCALYLLRPGDVPAGEDPASYYSRGIPVY